MDKTPPFIQWAFSDVQVMPQIKHHPPTLAGRPVQLGTHGILIRQNHPRGRPQDSPVCQAVHQLLRGFPTGGSVAEQIASDLTAGAAQIGGGHPFQPVRQRMTAELLGQRRIEDGFAVIRAPGDGLLRLFPDCVQCFG